MSISLAQIDPILDDDQVRVVIETPKGHRNKYTYNPDLEQFELGGVLTAGAVFPFDFGFVPRTKAEDGDPLDVLVLMDEPAYPGTIVTVRAIGIIEVQQTSKKEDNRNDRLLAVHTKCHIFHNVHDISDLPEHMVHEIVHFFVSYNAAKGVEFKPLGKRGAQEALKKITSLVQAKP